MKALTSVLLVVALVLVMFASPAATAATLYVGPDETYTEIQPAINAAVNGDEIVVRDGVYTGPNNKNLDFFDKAISLRSDSGPANCIIDCEGNGTGVNFFVYSVPSNQVLDGFSIVNASWGTGFGGSAIFCDIDSKPQIRNCFISGNSAFQGGGIYCYGSSPVITDCTISGNFAGLHGGGIYCYDSLPVIDNCDISDNTAGVGGGGFICHSSSPKISNSLIRGNWGYDYGGGVSSNYSASTLTNCIIIDNSTYGSGGGVDIYNSSSKITNCTIVGNSALWEDGGGLFEYSSQATMTNCILWNNLAYGGGPEIALTLGSSLTVSYSDVLNGQAEVHVESGCTLVWDDGNIDADPVFVGGGDFHLTEDSPCIDTGTYGGVYDDIDGDVRPQGAGYDMGADEYVPPSPEEEIEAVIGEIAEILNNPSPELTPEAQKALEEALFWLAGNNKGNSQNGTLDKLASGDLGAALNKVRQAIDALDAASAASSDTEAMQQILAEVARDLASAAIDEVEQALIDAGMDPALNPDFLAAESFAQDGEDLLAAEQYYDAVSAFIQAVGAANQALSVLP